MKKMIRKTLYYIDLDTGKVHKELSKATWRHYETYGYRAAHATARLIKQRRWNDACEVANKGVAERKVPSCR